MISNTETQRLAALHALDVLDTPPEAIFDSLTQLAALTFKTPIALVSLVDAQRQWFKSCVGLDDSELPRSVAFCDHAIRQTEVFAVLDAKRDPRFCDNPLVTSQPGIRFYAGGPLMMPSGEMLGTLCIIDTKPRATFDDSQRAQLQAMAATATEALIMRRDISRFIEVERERKTNLTLLDQAEEMTGIGHWSWDLVSGVTTWSPAVYRIHGYDPSLPPPDLPGILALYHPQDAADLAQLVSRAVSEGEPYALNARLFRPDGEARFVSARGGCERDETGAIRALAGTFIDVTDLKLADEKIRTNEARLNFVMEKSADLIMRVEPAKGITWISPNCSHYGYRPDDLIGTFASELVHPDDRAKVEAARAARFAGLPDPPGSTGELRIRKKDGSWIHVQENPTVIRGADGQVLEIVNVMRDLSAQRERARVLEAAREAAEAAAQVKTDFMANMSHEIRTPLTAILGYTGLLSERADLTVEARDQLGKVTVASDALLTLVNSILDFSKLEAGQVEITPRPTSPSSLLRDALLIFALQAQRKGIDLDFVVVNDLPDGLLIDKDRTRQILLNLIGNAVKFTNHGAVRLKVAYAPVTARLDFWIEDTGPGISPDQQKKLFQHFSQADASSTRSHGGTGLGLAICKGLTQAMGGEIGVVSQIGVGSVFHVQIPAPVSDSPAHLAEGQMADPLEGLRLLVVDDNPVNRELARAILEPMGALVDEAASGEEGLTKAAHVPFDLIMLDVRMPDLDGPTVLTRLRAEHGPNDNVPVLAFTAEASELVDQLGRGFDGVVSKPMVPRDVAAAILDALDIRHALEPHFAAA